PPGCSVHGEAEGGGAVTPRHHAATGRELGNKLPRRRWLPAPGAQGPWPVGPG
ncbi:Os10g0156300, partial [Oryza sativa Japonica Group]